MDLLSAEDVPHGQQPIDLTRSPGEWPRIKCRAACDETGGRFYTASNVAGLPEDLQYTGRGVTTIEERELWHMPIVLLTLLALMGAEWALRRRQGLA